LRTADHNGSPDIAGKTVRDYKRIEFQNKTIPNYAEMFSPLVLADRAVFVLLCIYFFFWPVWYASEEKLSVRIGEFRIEHLAVVVLMLLGLASLMRRRSFIPGFWPLCGLLIYGASALAWSVNPKAGALVLLNFFSVFFFAEILARNRRRQWSAMVFFLAGLLLMLVVSVIRAEVPGASDFRLVFPEGIDPNQLAVQGAMAVVILTYVAVAKSKAGGGSAVWSWGAFLLGLPVVGVIVLTGSRTGIVAVIAGASIVLFLRNDSSRGLRIWHSRLTLIPLGAVLGTLLIVPLMQSRSAPLLERYEEGFFKGDLAGRDDVWKASATYFASSPRLMLLGGGLGSFDQSVVDYLSEPLREIAIAMGAINPSRPYPYFAAHNDFVRLGCDLGIIGLALFLAFYVELGRACFRAAVAVRGSVLQLALFVTLIVSSMALDLVTFPVYAIILALVIAPCVKHRPQVSAVDFCTVRPG
jgi:O-antigen ligase